MEILSWQNKVAGIEVFKENDQWKCNYVIARLQNEVNRLKQFFQERDTDSS